MEQLPKVLAISLNAWRKDSPRSMQTDLFSYWSKDRLAQIYTKSDLPYTEVCEKFFRISENALLHSVFSRKPVGEEVQNCESADETTQKVIEKEKRLYDFAHKKKSWALTLAREAVWSLGKWKTPALDNFVSDYDADVYFVPIYPVIYTAKLQLYIIKKFPKPYVCMLSDDNYSYKPCGGNPLAYLHRFFLRKQVKTLVEGCEEILCGTSYQAKETDELFGTHAKVLSRGINYEGRTFKEYEPHSPVKMVYTGNLLIGRANALCDVARALAIINQNKTKITLDIYTDTPLSERSKRMLNSGGCTLHNAVERSEIERIQTQADILLFVEALKKSDSMKARLSFSTKLTDYFGAGKCIFAVGNSEIAPIMHLKDNDAAIVAGEKGEILSELKDLCDNGEKIKIYAKKAFECGKKHHESKDMEKIFKEAFLEAKEQKGKHV